MCYSLFAALFSKTFLSHPPFKYPRSAPAFTSVTAVLFLKTNTRQRFVLYQVEKVRVGHDAHGPGLGWYLEELSVTVPSRDEHVVFPCHCWLAEDQGDGKLERELSSTQGTRSNF